MFVHIWRMRARKKRVQDYEKFAQFVTMPSLKKLDGCVGAHFIRIFEARKPEYLWVVFWRDQKALEAARTNPVWRDQKKKFEAAQFYKTIPLELICEELESFGVPSAGAEKSKDLQNAKKPATSNSKKRKSNASEEPGASAISNQEPASA